MGADHFAKPDAGSAIAVVAILMQAIEAIEIGIIGDRGRLVDRRRARRWRPIGKRLAEQDTTDRPKRSAADKGTGTAVPGSSRRDRGGQCSTKQHGCKTGCHRHIR